MLQHLRRSSFLSRWPLATAGLVGTCALVMGGAAQAVTVAYWRFEGAPNSPNPPVSGDWLRPTAGRTAIEATPAAGAQFIDGYDSSGNGNTLYTWNDDGGGLQYRPTVLNKTGANLPGPSNYLLQNNGGTPTGMTWSSRSTPAPTLDIETHIFNQFTIEFTAKPTTVNGAFRTVVGRDGNNVWTQPAPGGASNAPLYFQMNNQNFWRIEYSDEAGFRHEAIANNVPIIAHQTYHVAATMDGSTLRLFVDASDGQGLVERAVSTTPGASPNSALTYDKVGSDTAGDTVFPWSVSRGRFGTGDGQGANHVDRFLGQVDEVRISNNALTPAQLLFAGQNNQLGPHVTIDRVTGVVTLKNTQASFKINGYRFENNNGSLDTTKWSQIGFNLDSFGNGTFDPDGSWDYVQAATPGLIQEGETAGGDGGSLGTTAGPGNLASIQLGGVGAWIKSPNQNMTASISIDHPDGDFLYTIPVIFEGNNNTPWRRSDLDFNNLINGADWAIFRANHRVAIANTLTDAQSYSFGDLDGDQDNDFTDFRLFQGDFNAANGEGAFEALVASVPEPGSMALLAMGLGAGLLRRRRTA